MNSITRTLCQRYTNLTDDEIVCLENMNNMLQPLANAEQADVFIDCITFTGKTAIVVSEAKPQTVVSNYSFPILGMLINLKDEPAVERTFHFQKPTKGMLAVSMPENKKIVQTTEGIFYNGKLVGVLIFEKKANLEEIQKKQSRVPAKSEIASIFGKVTQPIIDHLSESVVIIGMNDEVIACNSAARKLYSEKLGYVEDILGMTLKNIQPDSDEYFLPGNDINDSGIKEREVVMRSHNIHYTMVPIYSGSIKLAIIIDDVTDLREQEKKSGTQEIAMREQRHRIKNSLFLLSGMLQNQEKYASELDASMILRETTGRINAVAATLEEIVHVSEKSVSLKYILEKVRTNVLQSSLSKIQPVNIKINSDDIDVVPQYASPIALVVNELLQNALKHAFPSGKMGTVLITAEKGDVSTKISVKDNGVGFFTDVTEKHGMGFDIVKTIVEEKLNGELNIKSSEEGTEVVFDFIE